MNNFERLKKIERAVDDLRGASMLVKAQKAEIVLLKTVDLLRGIIEENEKLKKIAGGF